jgi:hypothetical protein
MCRGDDQEPMVCPDLWKKKEEKRSGVETPGPL